jgi:hypothetical protein
MPRKEVPLLHTIETLFEDGCKFSHYHHVESIRRWIRNIAKERKTIEKILVLMNVIVAPPNQIDGATQI